MTPAPDPAVVAELQRQFAWFAANALKDDPLYGALADAVARHPD